MKPDTTIYFGARGSRGPNCLMVNKEMLSMAPSVKIHNHSPNGFEWGYEGSGPAQLALAICLDFLEGDADRAEAIYQDFKRRIIAPIRMDSWYLDGREVREAIEQIEAAQVAAAAGGVQ